MRSLETEKSNLFGNRCLDEKIVLVLNKMRFKDGKGDNNLPQPLIVRYRGNRLHVLFKLAATYITHYENINLCTPIYKVPEHIKLEGGSHSGFH